MITKFIGKFRDLIPNGFHFQKLYADNYRQYCLKESKYSDQSIRVWQHHGGYVEIADFGMYSALIFELYLNPEQLETYLYTPSHNTFKCNPYYQIVLNRVTESLEQYDFKIHDSMYQYYQVDDGHITEEQSYKNIRYIQETYRTIIMGKGSWLDNAIKTMIEKNWIDVDTTK
jgi:hypothetical protein